MRATLTTSAGFTLGLAAVRHRYEAGGRARARPARRAIITDVLGGELEFEFFHAWLNWIFLAAACASLLLLWARHQQQRDVADLPVFSKKP